MSSLYLDHFGLSKPPFQITPDLDFFFAGGQRGDILSALLHVAGHEEGIITLVAEVGSGKTLLARLMISRLAPHISTVYLANPSFTRDEILGAIARDLGLTNLPVSTEARLAALQQELLRRHALGQRVLLVIDEAHAMPPESLEEVRLLSNLETGQHKLVNILLFGQPELDELLSDSRLRQVRDRVVHRFKLTPLTAQDASAYVDHRLRAAGWKKGPLFTEPAMALLIKASGGRARRINLLADKALLSAYAQGLTSVQPSHVKDAIGELHEDFSAPSQPRPPAWVKWVASSAALSVCLAGLAVWVLEHQRDSNALAAIALTELVAPASAPVSNTAVQPAPDAAPKRKAVAVAVTKPVLTIDTDLTPQNAQVRGIPKPAGAMRPANDGSLAAIDPPTLQPYLQRTQAYLRRPDLGGYTLQIAAIRRGATAANYLNFASHHVDSAMIFAQLTRYNDRDFVAVYVGQYPSVGEANAALSALPDAIKTNKPMVRTWIKIKQEQPS